MGLLLITKKLLQALAILLLFCYNDCNPSEQQQARSRSGTPGLHRPGPGAMFGNRRALTMRGQHSH